ncbi:MAG: peptide ABC transporter substrate-binding protein [Xanthomonadales bacterium]|nr:peptide ABC transporter substrate-binding protein [Xanthomonadales bacterium]
MKKKFNLMRLPFLVILLLLNFSVSAGEKLVRGLGPEPDSLDIHLAQGVSALNVLRDIREGLMTLSAAGQPVNGVAESIDMQADDRLAIVHLKQNLNWSDGSPLRAADFVRGWQRAVAPTTAAANAVLLDSVVNAKAIRLGTQAIDSLGIRALDEYTLEIRLNRKLPWLNWLLAHPLTYPLADSLTEKTEAVGNAGHRNGPFNGAYSLTSWTPNDRLVLIRNPHFHSRESVALERIEYIPIPNPNTELNRFRAGELHMTETIPPARFNWLKENYADELKVYPYLGTFFLGLNLRQPPLAGNTNLRRALLLAIDRDKLTALVLAAGEKPAFSLVPPGLGEYQQQYPGGAGQQQAARETTAVALYRQAGYSKENPLHLELRINSSSTHRRMALAVSAMWKQNLGVVTRIVHEEWKVFVNNRNQAVITEVFRGGWIGDFPDPVTFLSLFISDNVQNWSGYESLRFNNLMALAEDQANPKQRLQLLQQAEKQLLDDVPMIPLYYYVSRHLVDQRVSGYSDNTLDIHLSRYLDLEQR